MKSIVRFVAFVVVVVGGGLCVFVAISYHSLLYSLSLFCASCSGSIFKGAISRYLFHLLRMRSCLRFWIFLG